MKKYTVKTGGQILLIPVSRIISNPDRIRKFFSKESLDVLCDSIKINGLLTPLAVCATADGDYMIISGERRFIAAKAAGLEILPCVLYSTDEKTEILAFADDLQHEKLNFFEQAYIYAELYYSADMSLKDISDKLSVAESEILAKLRLLNIPEDIKRSAVEYCFDEYDLLRLVRANNDGNIKEVSEEIIKEHLTRTAKTGKEKAEAREKKFVNEPVTMFRDTKIFENTVERAISTMLKSGFNALSNKDETEEYIEYKIRIHKKR